MADPFKRFPGVVLSTVLLAFIAAPASAQQADRAPVSARPLTLDQVLELAESRSEAIGIARTGVARAEGEHVRARSGRLPQLSASASYDRALASEFSNVFGSSAGGPACPPFTLDPNGPIEARVAEIERAIDCGAIGSPLFGGGDEEIDLPFGRKNTWRVNLAFSQAIYTGGRLGAQADIATATRASADLALASTRAQLLFDATQAFYDAALSERLVQIAEATLAQAEATVTQVQASFEAGAQPEFELLRARVARDNQRPGVIRERANREIALLRLKQLLDLPAGEELVLVAPLEGEVATPAVFAERLEGLEAADAVSGAETRTAVREVGALVQLREASLRATLAERRPSVAVNSTFGQVAYPSDLFPLGGFNTNWTIGATVNVPILTGGRQRGSEMVARAELDASRLQLQQVRELAALDTRSAQAELTAARAALDASAGTVEQAIRAYEIADVRYRAGVSTQLELADARLLLRQAEANRAQAARDLQVARARLALLPELPIGSAPGGAAASGPPASGLPASARPASTPQPGAQGGAQGGQVPQGSGGGRS
jgi:outer membrane protein